MWQSVPGNLPTNNHREVSSRRDTIERSTPRVGPGSDSKEIMADAEIMAETRGAGALAYSQKAHPQGEPKRTRSFSRSLTGRYRHFVLAAVDTAAWLVTLLAATATRHSIGGGEIDYRGIAALAALAAATVFLLSLTPRFHHSRTRRGSVADAQDVFLTWIIVAPILAIANYYLFGRPVPTSAFLLGLPLALMLMMGARMAWRVVYDYLRRPAFDRFRTRVIVFGAGEGAEQIIRAMLRDPDSSYVPVAVLDDDTSLANRSIDGVRVRGTRHDLARIAKDTQASELLIAIPSASSELVRKLDETADELGLKTRVLPSTTELLGLLQIGDIRELTPADLLGREEVTVDLESIIQYVTGKRVLVTGAGGSIGSELCRQLFQLAPSALFMLDRDETALHGVQLSIEGRALLDTPNLIVADIRDIKRVTEVFEKCRPEVVFHTAALKHLTLLEHHPSEGIKTNVNGTRNLLDAALAVGVDHFVNISTDKAADPTSVLGATKLMAERFTARAAQEASGVFVSVRFGNVLGSRGSVLPTFREQIALGGPITITDPDVTRYFMTIPEAVRLVLQAGAIGEAGEIMILDMGQPVKIAHLAEQLIRQSGKHIQVVYTGLREGEKLHEVLVSNAEDGVTRQHPRITHTAGSTELNIDAMIPDGLAEKLGQMPTRPSVFNA